MTTKDMKLNLPPVLTGTVEMKVPDDLYAGLRGATLRVTIEQPTTDDYLEADENEDLRALHDAPDIAKAHGLTVQEVAERQLRALAGAVLAEGLMAAYILLGVRVPKLVRNTAGQTLTHVRAEFVRLAEPAMMDELDTTLSAICNERLAELRDLLIDLGVPFQFFEGSSSEDARDEQPTPQEFMQALAGALRGSGLGG